MELVVHGAGESDATTAAARHRRLVAQIISIEERERRRLAASLHDGPLQDLAAVRLALGRWMDAGGESVSEAQDALQRVIAQLRAVVFDLYPPALETLGLEAALGDLIAEVKRRSGLDITLEVSPDAPSPQDQLVFSLLRELMSNVERHSHATEAAIRVMRAGGELTLVVDDDGLGLPEGRIESAVREGHIGLATTVERVQAVGGRISIRTGAGEGTTVVATLPARRSSDAKRSGAVADRSVPGSPIDGVDRRSAL